MYPLRGGSPFLLLGLASGVLFGLPGCDQPTAADTATTATPAKETEAVRQTLAAVVRIEAVRSLPNQGRMVKARLTGSGVIISAAGHVLTNYHVADDADYYRCYLVDGTVLDATCIGLDALTDLAVLQLDLSGRAPGTAPLPVAEFGDSDQLQPGEAVWALGSPASLAQSVTRGIVSNVSLVLPEDAQIVLDGENVGLIVRWILHDANIFPGNSGGPLVDRAGRIVGINEIGIARLGGAIPGNLAHRIGLQLVDRGHVSRGWTGLTMQAPLEADAGAGALVADIDPDSPAARAGLQPGDLVTACDGRPITGRDEVAIASFATYEAAAVPGSAIELAYRRGTATATAKVLVAEREPALQSIHEQRTWGAVFRNLSRTMARHKHLPDTRGVWIESVRPGGPAGQAEPELNAGDIVVALDATPVASLADLRSTTTSILADPAKGRDVLVTVLREGKRLGSVIDLRLVDDKRTTPQARRAWLGVEVQPLTKKLATRLGIAAESGVRLTQVHAETRAAAADLRVGDVVLKIDDEAVAARRAEDLDAFSRQIRRNRVDAEVVLTLWREGATLQVPVVLERQPVPAAEYETYVDDLFELTVREIAFEDRTRLQFSPQQRGLIVQNLVAAGWAALAGLRNDDLLLEAAGQPLTDLASFRTARETALKPGAPLRWPLKVQRGDRTLFIEVDLKPLNS